MSTRTRSTVRGQHVSRREERRIQQRRATQQRRSWFFGGAVAIAVVAAFVLIVANRDSGGANLPAVVAAAPLEAGIPADGLTIGDPNAPVTVVEYGDFQCPGCAQFAESDQARLIQDYVATGKVRFEFHPFSFLDRALSLNADGSVSAKGSGESVLAAEAALSAADQGKGWQYHDTIYANHNGENQGAYSRNRLIEMAKLIGLDVDAFTASLDQRTHKAEVEALYAQAVQNGVTQTPSFEINGKVSTYRGYDDLKAQIDAALAG
jgi:protein-disulfide isomerase